MAFEHALVRTLALAGALAFAGCSAEDGGNSPGGAGGGGGAPTTCNTDPARLANHEPVSFKADIMPMMGLSCVLGTQCHNSSPSKAAADLKLGYKCKFDETAKWKCTFPATAEGPDLLTDDQPLTQTLVDEVYAALMADSLTVPGGPDGGPAAMKRVVPGDPSASFLVDKLSDAQNDKPYKDQCVNQDPRRSGTDEPCGTEMPAGTKGFCLQGATGQAKFDAVSAWILQGALNN